MTKQNTASPVLKFASPCKRQGEDVFFLQGGQGVPKEEGGMGPADAGLQREATLAGEGLKKEVDIIIILLSLKTVWKAFSGV